MAIARSGSLDSSGSNKLFTHKVSTSQLCTEVTIGVSSWRYSEHFFGYVTKYFTELKGGLWGGDYFLAAVHTGR